MTKSGMKAFTEALIKVRGMLTDKQALEVPALYPTWNEGVEYVVGTRLLYNGVLYRVIVTHMSKPELTPDIAIDLFIGVVSE